MANWKRSFTIKRGIKRGRKGEEEKGRKGIEKGRKAIEKGRMGIEKGRMGIEKGRKGEEEKGRKKRRYVAFEVVVNPSSGVKAFQIVVKKPSSHLLIRYSLKV